MKSEQKALEMRKLRADVIKAELEAKKLRREILWYPVVAASGLIGAIAALTALVVKAIS